MGEVYKARDTRLERTVAIKVLPPEWADAPGMRERFDREAQAIASLNHPHICALHDRGPNYLVMEYLEGETLADRLKRGALPLGEALDVGIAIADALDKAHGQGVVHRDLKPGNIFLTRNGPKLLDFGLAKTSTPSPDSSQLTRSPTTPLTRAGTIIGTLQYMAPEQLEGLDADARTDIFALGVILHEMITGTRAFEGKTQVLLMSAIATTEPPPVSRIQPGTPPALDHIIKVCLAKDRDNRWQTARDLLAELRWVGEGGDEAPMPVPAAAAPSGRQRWRTAALAAAGILIAALAIPAVAYFRAADDPERLELRVSLAPLNYSGNPNLGGFFAVSPDGRQLVVRARPGGGQTPFSLYVGTLDFLAPRLLSGTDNAIQPFWSPDGQQIGYLADNKLWKVSVNGGPPQRICDTPQGTRGGTWNRDGTILLGSPTGLMRVPADGGTPAPVTTLAAGETGHYWPAFLPDGRRFLFLAVTATVAERTLVAGSLDSRERTRVGPGTSNVGYVEPGWLVYQRSATLYAQRFDAESMQLSGEPIRLADAIPANTTGRASFSVTASGVIVYYRDLLDPSTESSETDDRSYQIAWVGRSGELKRTVGAPGAYRGLEVSPDGRRVAAHRHEPKGGDVWVLEPDGTEKRITFNPAQENSHPIWSPQGDRIAYASLRNQQWGLYHSASDGSGREEPLFESPQPKVPMSWSPDSKRIVFWVLNETNRGDLWVLSLEDKKAEPLIATEANEQFAQISPDGSWIAYSSDITGRREVYVQPFPIAGTARWQISPSSGAGANLPRWTRQVNELLYHSLGNQVTATNPTPGNELVAPLFSAQWKSTGGAFVHEPVRPVVRIVASRLEHPGGVYHTYGVSPDGQHLLIFQRMPNTTQAGTEQTGPDPAGALTVLMNWMPKRQ